MSQQAIQPPPAMQGPSELASEQRAFPKKASSLQMVSKRITASKKTITTSIDRVVAFWHALPAQRRRLIVLLGLSVYLSVAMSATVTLLARLANRQQERER